MDWKNNTTDNTTTTGGTFLGGYTYVDDGYCHCNICPCCGKVRRPYKISFDKVWC